MLLEAGLRPGMRVLDMACGVGTVSCWLAGQVGPTGKVVAADISASQLGVARAAWEACGDLPEIDFVEASAYDTRMPAESFDLVHCRLMLCHIECPEAVLREFYRLLKPGGVLVCHELYLDGVLAAPRCKGYERSKEIGHAAAKVLGANYNFGLSLPAAAMDAGFQTPTIRLDYPMYLDGPKKRLMEWTIEEAVPMFLRSGATTQEEMTTVLAEMRRTTQNEKVLVAQYPLVGIWARK
jgi:ubiquinone/menaquinone biosynthesis C-methylase UbiE